MWIMCGFFLPFKDYCASSELSYSAAQKEFHIATVGVCVYVQSVVTECLMATIILQLSPPRMLHVS